MKLNVWPCLFSHIFSCTENISKKFYTNKAQEAVTVCLNQKEIKNQAESFGNNFMAETVFLLVKIMNWLDK